MLSISAYTEPAINPVALSELAQVNEPEEKKENNESGSFAELLTALLRNPQESREINPEIPAAESSFGEINEDQLLTAQKFTLLKETPVSNIDMEEPEKTLASLEKMDLLFGMLKTIPEPEAVTVENGEGSFYQELSNLIRSELAPESELNADFFDIDPKIDASQNSQQIAGAVQNAQESSDETAAKKEKAQKTSVADENIKTLAGLNEREEAASKAEMLRINRDNEKPGKLDEMRNNLRSRRDKLTIEVNDMRTGSREAANSQNNYLALEASAGRTGTEAQTREITLELRLPEQNNILNQANTSWEAKSGQALENLLARELHQNFNGDIIRHASMALKDGGEGTIKIALKPESLGNVKIALELSDNKITGKIFVESEEAMNAFRKEIASLEQGFKDAGFAAADLNLSLAQEGQDAETRNDNPVVPPVIASSYEDNSEKKEFNLVNVFIGQRKSSINLLA